MIDDDVIHFSAYQLDGYEDGIRRIHPGVLAQIEHHKRAYMNLAGIAAIARLSQMGLTITFVEQGIVTIDLNLACLAGALSHPNMSYRLSFAPEPYIIAPSPFARRSECAGATVDRPHTGYTDGVAFGVTAGETVVEAIRLGACEILHVILAEEQHDAWLTGEAGRKF